MAAKCQGASQTTTVLKQTRTEVSINETMHCNPAVVVHLDTAEFWDDAALY